jgi:hypothetical protein
VERFYFTFDDGVLIGLFVSFAKWQDCYSYDDLAALVGVNILDIVIYLATIMFHELPAMLCTGINQPHLQDCHIQDHGTFAEKVPSCSNDEG